MHKNKHKYSLPCFLSSVCVSLYVLLKLKCSVYIVAGSAIVLQNSLVFSQYQQELPYQYQNNFPVPEVGAEQLGQYGVDPQIKSDNGLSYQQNNYNWQRPNFPPDYLPQQQYPQNYQPKPQPKQPYDQFQSVDQLQNGQFQPFQQLPNVIQPIQQVPNIQPIQQLPSIEQYNSYEFNQKFPPYQPINQEFYYDQPLNFDQQPLSQQYNQQPSFQQYDQQPSFQQYDQQPYFPNSPCQPSPSKYLSYQYQMTGCTMCPPAQDQPCYDYGCQDPCYGYGCDQAQVPCCPPCYDPCYSSDLCFTTGEG